MPSRQEIAQLEQASAEADAAQQIEALNGIRRDDVLNSETRAAVQGLGFGSAAVKSTNDADRYITLYHRYDGRERAVPKYMAARYVIQRFTSGDREIPDEHWGKQVWMLNPDSDQIVHDASPRDFVCRMSPLSQGAVKDEIIRAGLSRNCRKQVKGGGYQNQFDADEHFRKKHPRRWAAYQRFLGTDTANRGTDALVNAVQAMREMAANMVKQAPAPGKKD